MMSEPATRKATYDDLYSIPENMTGEIVSGELIVTPKPSVTHSNASAILNFSVVGPYGLGKGGPGGWIILPEVEILLGEHLLVPDISGWKRERFPGIPKENWISVRPDWVCEILSPRTERLDRVRKMPIYAQYEIPHIWLINPIEKTLEVFRLESGKWLRLAAFAEDDKVRAEPFDEIEIALGDFWME
ncbi:MAG: Uma2 family endonuclease [Syntrophobacteraceae bacterium]